MTTQNGSRHANGETQPHEPITWLVTGAAGFIGSHLCDALIARGDTVLGLDNLTTGRIENVEHLRHHPRFHFARADVADAVVMDRLASQATIIVHLAAAVGVELVVERPAYTIETNVMGTEAVLRSALRYGTRVLLASTSEVYGKGSRIPFGEDDDILLGPTSKSRWGYAASKMVDEFLGMAYYHEHGLEVVPFRLFNTTGPRQSSRYGMVVPRFVGQALRNEPITIYGDGSQRGAGADCGGLAAHGLHDSPGRAGRATRGVSEQPGGYLHEIANRPVTRRRTRSWPDAGEAGHSSERAHRRSCPGACGRRGRGVPGVPRAGGALHLSRGVLCPTGSGSAA